MDLRTIRDELKSYESKLISAVSSRILYGSCLELYDNIINVNDFTGTAFEAFVLEQDKKKMSLGHYKDIHKMPFFTDVYDGKYQIDNKNNYNYNDIIITYYYSFVKNLNNPVFGSINA